MQQCTARVYNCREKVLPISYYTPGRPRFHPAKTLTLSTVLMALSSFGVNTLADHEAIEKRIRCINRPFREWMARIFLGKGSISKGVAGVVNAIRAVYPDRIPEAEPSCLTVNEIIISIKEELPVILLGLGSAIPWAWRTRLLGHALLVVGYGEDDNGTYLFINDPRGNPLDGYLDEDGSCIRVPVRRDFRFRAVAFREDR